MKILMIAGLICTVLAALAVACGDDDKATNTPGAATTTAVSGGDATTTRTATGGGTENINDYFSELAGSFDSSQQDSDDATAQVKADLEDATTLEEQKLAINDFLDTMIQVFDDSILEMNDLSVPAIAEGPHFSFRDDIVQAKAMSETLKAYVEAADTGDEAKAVINDFDAKVGPLVNHAQTACRDLQEIADAQNINEDLACKPA